jgi:hypothetical protein
MAKALAPYGATQVRGRIAAVVLNAWRGVQYIKRYTVPTNPNSATQLIKRAALADLSVAWAALSGSQRLTWTDYAATHTELDWAGNNVRLTGLNWFIRCNSRLYGIGEDKTNTAPVEAAPVTPVSFAAANGILSSACTYSNSGDMTGATIEFWAQKLNSLAVTPDIRKAKIVGFNAAPDGTDTITPLGVGYWAIFARCISETEGTISAWAMDTCTVTAT